MALRGGKTFQLEGTIVGEVLARAKTFQNDEIRVAVEVAQSDRFSPVFIEVKFMIGYRAEEFISRMLRDPHVRKGLHERWHKVVFFGGEPEDDEVVLRQVVSPPISRTRDLVAEALEDIGGIFFRPWPS